MSVLQTQIKSFSQGSSHAYFCIALVLLILNSLSALVFIAMVRQPVYDDPLNFIDVERYTKQGVTLNTIRGHINAQGPTAYIWMACVVRLIGGDSLRDARLAVLFSWLLLGVGLLTGARYTRWPSLWYAAMMVTLVLPHALTAMSTVLTEGPALLFGVIGSMGFAEFVGADRPRRFWLGSLSALFMGLAVTVRQYYAALPAAALFFALWYWWRRQPRRGKLNSHHP